MKKSTAINTINALYAVCLNASTIGQKSVELQASKTTLKDNMLNVLPQDLTFIDSCQTLASALDMAKRFHFADVQSGDKVASKAASNKLVACLQAASKAVGERFIEEKAVAFTSHKTAPVAWEYRAEAKTEDEKLFTRLQSRFPLTFNESTFTAIIDSEAIAQVAETKKVNEEKAAFHAEKLRLASSEITTVYDHIVKTATARGLDAKTVAYTLFDTNNISDVVLDGVLAKMAA